MSDKKKHERKKRSKTKYAALIPKFNSRVRQEYLDMDYLHLLSVEELDFLNKFMEEYNNASFTHTKDDLHQDPNHVKDSYNRNNARNRCLYGLLKMKVGDTKVLNYDAVKNLVENELAKEIDPSMIEDSMIEYMDYINLSSKKSK